MLSKHKFQKQLDVFFCYSLYLHVTKYSSILWLSARLTEDINAYFACCDLGKPFNICFPFFAPLVLLNPFASINKLKLKSKSYTNIIFSAFCQRFLVFLTLKKRPPFVSLSSLFKVFPIHSRSEKQRKRDKSYFSKLQIASVL